MRKAAYFILSVDGGGKSDRSLQDRVVSRGRSVASHNADNIGKKNCHWSLKRRSWHTSQYKTYEKLYEYCSQVQYAEYNVC